MKREMENKNNINNENKEMREMAMATLSAKHKNGGASQIHRQLFFELKKEKCPVCDLPAKTYIEVQRELIDLDAQKKMLTAEVGRGGAKPYDPKSAPAAMELKCATCGNVEQVNDDYIKARPRLKGDPVPARVASEPFECSKCWWERVGSKV